MIRFTAGTLVMATYGHEVTSEDDIITQLAVDSAIRFIEGGTPGATIVDFIPFCENPILSLILMLNCSFGLQCDTFQRGFLVHLSRNVPISLARHRKMLGMFLIRRFRSVG